MIKAINKKSEKLSFFNGHTEAEEWFRDKFRDQFIMKGSGEVNGEIIYFYHIVTDREYYINGIKEIIENDIVNGFKLPSNYHIVGILEDGRVHIIY